MCKSKDKSNLLINQLIRGKKMKIAMVGQFPPHIGMLSHTLTRILRILMESMLLAQKELMFQDLEDCSLQ